MSNNTYDFSNAIRDVDVAFDTLVANSPSFLKLLGSVGTSFDPITGAPVVKNHKYEWVNDSMGQYATAISGFGTDGDGTVINVASSTGFEVGSIVRFESTAGASKTELARVTAVNSATQVEIARDYGSTTGVTLIVGDVMILNSTPKNEGSSVGSAIKHEGTIDFNYTEIFDEAANLSKSALATLTYDGATAMQYQVRAAMVRLARKLENASLYGVRVQRTSSVAGTMGGVIAQISASGGNIEAAGGNALSQAYINNVIEDIVADGGMMSRPVILCSPNQARKLSALNTSGTNPIVYKDNSDRTLGNFTTAFIGDLPINGSGIVAQVFQCQNMVKDKVAIIDMDLINLRVMRGLSSTDATVPGNDEFTQRLLTELTLEVKNATKAHGIITGLAL